MFINSLRGGLYQRAFRPLSAAPALDANELFAPIDSVVQVNPEAAFDQVDVAINTLAFVTESVTESSTLFSRKIRRQADYHAPIIDPQANLSVSVDAARLRYEVSVSSAAVGVGGVDIGFLSPRRPERALPPAAVAERDNIIEVLVVRSGCSSHCVPHYCCHHLAAVVTNVNTEQRFMIDTAYVGDPLTPEQLTARLQWLQEGSQCVTVRGRGDFERLKRCYEENWEGQYHYLFQNCAHHVLHVFMHLFPKETDALLTSMCFLSLCGCPINVATGFLCSWIPLPLPLISPTQVLFIAQYLSYKEVRLTQEAPQAAAMNPEGEGQEENPGEEAGDQPVFPTPRRFQ